MIGGFRRYEESKGERMGLLDSIFHRKKAESSNSSAISPEVAEEALTAAERIIQDYGAAMLSKRATQSGRIADVRKLPHSKELIKQAIVLVLRVTEDSQFREQLKSSYLLLAGWQEGVGDAMVGIYANVNPGGDPAEIMRVMTSQGAEWKAWEKWRPRVMEEERALTADLKKLGLWSRYDYE
ncbi:hypothetical protein SBBP2_3090007 [Burkholderiales bacterium]|jgi:hypothetical protein|nr:hypothetical protein SBBP2_3090007 [Burkholderiales bacterium]